MRSIFLILFLLIKYTRQDEIYLGSLAANIEKAGLLTNFNQAWSDHMNSWHASNEMTRENEGLDTGAFRCNTSRPDNETNHSVDKLHPSHIEIIGALGDSFIAGTGANASRLLEMTLQYRGLSFPIGGDGNLTNTDTLPNILKEYNPRIRGWSRSIGPAWFEELAGLNVAVPGATASDLEDQAKELVKRIKRIPRANEKWKMISIFIGMGDLCQACEHSAGTGQLPAGGLELDYFQSGGKASSYGRNVRNALDRLSKELKRTIVNLIALPPVFQWYRQLHDDRACIALHRYLCPCVLRPSTDRLAFQYNSELYRLPERFNRYDFAVVVQPFMSGRIQFPDTMINGTNRTDDSFFAPDCYHLSRRGHSVAARALWANLFQAIGEKDSNMNLTNNEFACPDESCPYIRTWGNLKTCPHQPITLPPIIANHTIDFGNFTENFTAHPMDRHHLVNVTDHHHYFTIQLDNGSIVTAIPWHENDLRMMNYENIHSEYSTARLAWIVFGVVLALAVIATLIGSIVYSKKHRIRNDQKNERTPLLAGDHVDQIY